MYTIGEDYIRLSSNISDTTSDIVKALAVAFTTEVNESDVMNFLKLMNLYVSLYLILITQAKQHLLIPKL